MNKQFGSPEHLAALQKIREITAAGYAGVLSNGNIVDRREHPEAIPIPKNDLLGVPQPKQITAAPSDPCRNLIGGQSERQGEGEPSIGPIGPIPPDRPRPLFQLAIYDPGITGPEYAVLLMRGGRAIQINDEGIIVWPSLDALRGGNNADIEHAITFTPR